MIRVTTLSANPGLGAGYLYKEEYISTLSFLKTYPKGLKLLRNVTPMMLNHKQYGHIAKHFQVASDTELGILFSPAPRAEEKHSGDICYLEADKGDLVVLLTDKDPRIRLIGEALAAKLKGVQLTYDV